MRTIEAGKSTIFEYEPCRRTVQIAGYTHNLPLPYQVFIQKRTAYGKILYLGFRVNPLNLKDYRKQQLLFPPLPTVFLDSHRGVGVYESWAVCAHPTVQRFWTSSFSSIDCWECNNLIKYDLGGLLKWGKMKYPELVKCFEKWKDPHKITIQEILDRQNSNLTRNTAEHVLHLR